MSATLQHVLIGAGIADAVAALLVAAYGHDFGYPAFPLFLASLFIGFPIVLLVVAIGSRHGPVKPKTMPWLASRHKEPAVPVRR
jgi:hypothetical protein